MRIYIGGTQGVGKTTIAQEMCHKHPEYSWLSGSSLMMKICGVSSRAELEKLDPARKKELEKTRYVDIVRGYSNLFVDGHYQLTRPQVECFTFFVYITCPLEVLKQRVALDTSRSRSLSLADLEQGIRIHDQRLNDFREMFPLAPVHVIDNVGKLELTVNNIEMLINQYTR